MRACVARTYAVDDSVRVVGPDGGGGGGGSHGGAGPDARVARVRTVALDAGVGRVHVVHLNINPTVSTQLDFCVQ